LKTVRTYATRLDADLAKLQLDAAGIPAVVVGVGAEVEGGAAGVQLLVPEEWSESALKILEHS
jgi:Putative prokaryotic signal transducing protein